MAIVERTVVTLEVLTAREDVRQFVESANGALRAMGYTEHGERHVRLVAKVARRVLLELGYSHRDADLAEIAGYLHDIGNIAGRSHHGQTSALLAFPILREEGMSPKEIAMVLGAIGNHEEEYGEAISPVSAALILADKSDVHRSRVQTEDPAEYDVHDRVNAAVQRSDLVVDPQSRLIVLQLDIDDSIAPMDYFEIFLSRMVMCRRAAEVLNCRFGLTANGQRLL
ncbi:MAG: HD domain-containing protein [Thermaerobacter sp.]|nr:HD domain-containing protein [Thermaerobacter sp.]